MYRFFLNDAIMFDRSLQLGVEAVACANPPGKSIWGEMQQPWPCREDMTTTWGIMTIAYLYPFASDSFLPVVMKEVPSGTLSLPPSLPGGYPSPPEQPPGRGYPPPPTATPPPGQEPPVSGVAPLAPYQNTLSFPVAWSGTDPGGSGIASYDVQYRDRATATWTGWLTATTALSAAFGGQHGHTYDWRCRARDYAGNVEAWPLAPDYDTSTLVDILPPDTTVEALPVYTTTASFVVRWHGADDASGLDHYDLFYRDESAASWSPWLEGVTVTRATFGGAVGHTYHFCSRGVDRAGNAERCPPISAGGEWPIQSDAFTGVAPGSRVQPLPAYTGSRTFVVSWSGSAGVQGYDVQVRDGLYGLWQTWLSNTTKTSASYTGQYGHIYCFRSRARQGTTWEVYPYDYDTFTKLVEPSGLGGPMAPLEALPPDEAPDRMEDVTQTQALGTLVSGYIAPTGDVDWYRFELTETMRLRAQLSDLPADFDLYVFDGSGRFLWASTWGRRLPEAVVVQAPAGVYYVQLVGYAGDWSGDTPYRPLVERAGGGQ